ncbi:OsmC family protein [Natronosporangium hydrolyticum]|uniref:OsmC family protein n=1 Tax=Natronosporangium hydrolyticum TaxID=2811111 RepID=A0A895Y9V5_9ACTN|nr:OsmC family protein [Natronosporangium hydrolyticum]QSB14527.1 OsmC family protein [Natronosporangium hydrolyticum]
MSDQKLRSVTLRRTEEGRFVATNPHGAAVELGTGDDVFSPVELLLAGIAGCTGMDVAAITARRAEPESFEVSITARKERDDAGNHLADLEVVFRVSFPAGEAGDAAREVLPEAVTRSHTRLCTVSQTVERATPITVRIE